MKGTAVLRTSEKRKRQQCCYYNSDLCFDLLQLVGCFLICCYFISLCLLRKLSVLVLHCSLKGDSVRLNGSAAEPTRCPPGGALARLSGASDLRDRVLLPLNCSLEFRMAMLVLTLSVSDKSPSPVAVVRRGVLMTFSPPLLSHQSYYNDSFPLYS